MLTESNLPNVDISQSKLIGSDLSRANISNSDLSESDFSMTNLSLANLTGSDISGTNLSKAKLVGSKLSQTLLVKANLTDANLSEADLSWSDIRGLNLTRSLFIRVNTIQVTVNEETRTKDIILANKSDPNYTGNIKNILDSINESLRIIILRDNKNLILSALWNVPFPRNPFFVGREKVLEQLHNSMKSNKAVASFQAINGLGGIGKTQIAVEYSYRYRKEYEAVLWVRANSFEILVSDYVALAQVLNLPEKNAKEQNKTIDAVKRWLIGNSGWLLVFDNADEPGLLKNFFPFNSKGDILLTSRADNFDKLGIADPVNLDKMTPSEAKEFLKKRTGREASTQAEKDALSEITKELDYLPLALEQAGAYIKKASCSYSTYLSSYRGRGLKLLSQSPPDPKKYPESVATTWLLNFDMVEKANRASADILKFSAFLSPDSIPLELITTGASELGEDISKALSGFNDDPLLLDELLAPLTQYSLITRDISTRTYSIHRLLQAVIRNRLGVDTQRQWAERIVRSINSVFPDIEISNWYLCNRLLPHAMVCAGLIDQWGFEFKEAARLLNEAGNYKFELAQYVESEQLYKRALAIREKSLGEEHPDVATSLNNLAGLYRAQGKYAEAEHMYSHALAIREKSLGKGHPDVATSLNNLAELYITQGKYAEAEPLYRRALEIYEKVVGTDHPLAATLFNNLAELYKAQGKYAEAEPLYRRALAIREKSLDKDHPDVATSLNNLAALFMSQGVYAEAEPLYRRALEIYEKSLGTDHPFVAASLNNVAELYRAQGRYVEAEPLYRRVLEIYEKSMDSDQLSVARSLNNLALLYDSQGRYAEAETLFRRTLAMYEKSLGTNHPSVATSLNNLSSLYMAQGKYAEAEPLYRRALEICKESLGENHPNTIFISQKLTDLIQEMRGSRERKK